MIKTKLLSFSAQNILISVDILDDGWIEATIFDKNGKYIMTSEKIIKTMTDGTLQFEKNINLDEIQLEFEINKAKLYSFSFSN